MLEGLSIICFAHDWEGDPTSKTHIMRLLAKKNRVLWMNSIGMRRPTTSRGDLRRMLVKVCRAVRGTREVEPNLFVTNPLVLPFPGKVWTDSLNARILAAWIRHLCRRHAFQRPLLWTYLPNVNRLVGRLGERLVIYHCVDENSAVLGAPREALIRMEQDLVRRAHLVLTSSERLCEERRSLNPSTYFVSHGVEVLHFARALDSATVVPGDLRDLPRPVVGFFGLISEDWIDLSLLRSVALARPGWSFALLGKVSMDLALIRDLPNIYILGRKPYAALPAYCRGFDVAIIPFRASDLTIRANPLKLREYLAAGLPVVSTPLPEVARYDGLVHLANASDAFVAGIEAALTKRSPEMARRRLEAVQGEGWEVCVAKISALVGAHLGEAT